MIYDKEFVIKDIFWTEKLGRRLSLQTLQSFYLVFLDLDFILYNIVKTFELRDFPSSPLESAHMSSQKMLVSNHNNI